MSAHSEEELEMESELQDERHERLAELGKAALFAAECLMRASVDGDDLTAVEATIVDTARRLRLLSEEARP